MPRVLAVAVTERSADVSGISPSTQRGLVGHGIASDCSSAMQRCPFRTIRWRVASSAADAMNFTATRPSALGLRP